LIFRALLILRFVLVVVEVCFPDALLDEFVLSVGTGHTAANEPIRGGVLHRCLVLNFSGQR